MIEFKDNYNQEPHLIFKKKYDEALLAGQKNIEAIVISTFNKKKNEVDSRCVNLKFVDGNEFIFFSNYNSPKSIAIDSHNNISALFYWSSINVQIRMKAKIKKTSQDFNSEYFKKRSLDKNALAISSNQSLAIDSYNNVISKYNKVKENQNLLECPSYWGGFSFIPYYFEFWEGHEFRLNKRDSYQIINEEWHHSVLEP